MKTRKAIKKGYWPTAQDVWEEFQKELAGKINEAGLRNDVGPDGEGLLAAMDRMRGDANGRTMRMAEIKINLIREWERRGRNMAFLKYHPGYGWMELIHERAYGNKLQ